jgi:16S rRNA (guanine527-N7)-methyltransferase
VGKKTALVGEMARELGCLNVEVVNMRSEDFAVIRRESFDIAAARAVAHACTLAEYLAPLTRQGGELLAFKGKRAPEEIGIPSEKWERLGLSKPKLHPYSIEGTERYIVVWKKRAQCPTRFPRKAGLALKKPWQLGG